MTEVGAQKTVLAVFLIVGAVVVWDSLKKTGKAAPPFRTIVMLTVLAAVLAVGAGLAPEAVGPLALLIGIAVVVSRIGTAPKKA